MAQQQQEDLQNQQNLTTNKPQQESATDIIHFEKWLSILGERKATDLHLNVGNVPMVRVNGKVDPLIEEEVITSERIERIAESLLTEEELDMLSKERQIVFSRTLKKVMRFRIHIFYSRGFLAVSLRHLPNFFVPIENLVHAQSLSRVVSAQEGFYIIAGPFDSAKTSVARSIITKINQTQSKYIVTLEAPIEYIMPSDKSIVVQREVGTDVKSFTDGLLALNEEDVNVVFISAIEDAVVLERVLNLATSGRLVMATVSGMDIVSVLEALRDLVDDSDKVRILHLLADALLGMNTQILLPKIGGGRVLVASTMLATHPVKTLIRDGKFDQIPNIMQTSRQEGMVTMDKALAEAVQGGLVSLDDAKAHAVDPNQFNMLVAH